MRNDQELERVQKLLKGVYRRFRNGIITKDQAKSENELLCSIIKAIELNQIKEQTKYLINLLTKNRSKNEK